MRSYPVKENLISSAVSEILRHKQTHKHTGKQRNTQTDILLLYYKDIRIGLSQFELIFLFCYVTQSLIL